MSKHKKADKVFSSHPRVKSEETVWIDRSDTMKDMKSKFYKKGVSICLDGPTGSGKSSLVLSFLTENEVEYVNVKATKTMDWAEFCKEAMLPWDEKFDRHSVSMEIGIDKGLPTAKLSTSLEEDISNTEEAKRRSENTSVHDIGRLIEAQNKTLLIDDFERAREDIVLKVAELCKYLSSRRVPYKSKVVIVGTDDIYSRLFDKDNSLNERLLEVSLGSFPDRSQTWTLLRRGFEKLGMSHPGLRMEKDGGREMYRKSKTAAYHAANGLPKSINRLGYEVCSDTGVGNNATCRQIVNNARNMILDNWKRYRRDADDILMCVKNNHAALEVVKYLYYEGIGGIHRRSNVISSLSGYLDRGDIDNALNELEDVGFITRTGVSGEIFFPENPNLAHTLWVAFKEHDRYDFAHELHDNYGQLALALSST